MAGKDDGGPPHTCIVCRQLWWLCECKDQLMPSGRRSSYYYGSVEEWKRHIERAMPFTPESKRLARRGKEKMAMNETPCGLNMWDDCDGEFCEEADCPKHPDCEEKRTSREDMKKRLRSAEFAKEWMENVIAMCPGDAVEIQNRIGRLLDEVVIIAEANMRDSLKELVRAQVQAALDSRLGKTFDSLIEQAMAEQLALFEDIGGSTKLTTIREHALKAFKTRLDGLSSSRSYGKDTLTTILEKLVGEKANEAVEELKNETIEKFNKMVMKKMMEGMAKQIGSDKRLVAMLSDPDSL